MTDYATIVRLESFAAIRQSLGTKVVCTSGGYDPMHPGHATCIIESKKLGETLVVVVNGDQFLVRKKGAAFLDLQTRCHLVSCIRHVDFVIPFEHPTSMTVNEALEIIRPNVFTKGGDRTNPSNIAEWDTCQRLGIKVVTGVGLPKMWSSSELLQKWSERGTH